MFVHLQIASGLLGNKWFTLGKEWEKLALSIELPGSSQHFGHLLQARMTTRRFNEGENFPPYSPHTIFPLGAKIARHNHKKNLLRALRLCYLSSRSLNCLS